MQIFILVYSDEETITLMNLEPSTRYKVRVQLSRPGEGGEGAPGPEAIMETDCPGKINMISGSERWNTLDMSLRNSIHYLKQRCKESRIILYLVTAI